MIRTITSHDVSNGAKYIEFAGLSSDTKPTSGGGTVTIGGETTSIALATGSTFLEVDTGDVYAWDEVGETWNKICSLGGS